MYENGSLCSHNTPSHDMPLHHSQEINQSRRQENTFYFGPEQHIIDNWISRDFSGVTSRVTSKLKDLSGVYSSHGIRWKEHEGRSFQSGWVSKLPSLWSHGRITVCITRYSVDGKGESRRINEITRPTEGEVKSCQVSPPQCLSHLSCKSIDAGTEATYQDTIGRIFGLERMPTFSE